MDLNRLGTYALAVLVVGWPLGYAAVGLSALLGDAAPDTKFYLGYIAAMLIALEYRLKVGKAG